MRGRGLEQRVCDGTVDCPDFSGQGDHDHDHVGCDDHDQDGDDYEASKMSNTKMKKMTISPIFTESNSLDL